MPKKIKNCFYKNLTFQKLMETHKRARVHKAYKSEIITFEFNLENNITNLLNNIKKMLYLRAFFSLALNLPLLTRLLFKIL